MAGESQQQVVAYVKSVELLTHADASFRKGGQVNGKANRCLIPVRKLLPFIRDAADAARTEKYGRFFLPEWAVKHLHWVSFGADPKAAKIVPYRLSGEYMQEKGKGKGQEKGEGAEKGKGKDKGKCEGKSSGSGGRGQEAADPLERATLLHVLMLDLNADPLEKAQRMVIETVPPGKWQEFLLKVEETVIRAKMQHYREPGVPEMMARLPPAFSSSGTGGEFSWDDQPVGVWVKQVKLAELSVAYTKKGTKPQDRPPSHEAKRTRQAGW